MTKKKLLQYSFLCFLFSISKSQSTLYTFPSKSSSGKLRMSVTYYQDFRSSTKGNNPVYADIIIEHDSSWLKPNKLTRTFKTYVNIDGLSNCKRVTPENELKKGSTFYNYDNSLVWSSSFYADIGDSEHWCNKEEWFKPGIKFGSFLEVKQEDIEVLWYRVYLRGYSLFFLLLLIYVVKLRFMFDIKKRV